VIQIGVQVNVSQTVGLLCPVFEDDERYSRLKRYEVFTVIMNNSIGPQTFK